MTYAFTFDSSACSGCKACQAACKDKNNLPAEVLWRRIYEVGGGEWTKSGDAWTSTVYAYNLSIACNHCVHPKCAGVCPVDAFTVREDGIVLLDSTKCIGCGYCSWACPYGAPQYDPAAGRMTKCNLCYDNLDSGLAPACVSACPMRVLELVDQSEVAARGIQFQVIFPMPVTSRTEPRIYIKPHPAVFQSSQIPQILNHEEFSPLRKRSASGSSYNEIPLIAFTLLGQAAAGISWILGLFVFFGLPFSTHLSLAIGIILGLGMLISFLHLGSPQNAWRVFSNLHKSWLSRELLAALLFMVVWVINILPYFLSLHIGIGKPLLAGLTGLAGVVLVFSMSEVYRLRMVPAWNTWRTKVSFFLSAVILGVICVDAGQVITGTPNSFVSPQFEMIAFAGVISLGMKLVLAFSDNKALTPFTTGLMKVLTAVTLGTAVIMFFPPFSTKTWLVFILFPIIILEEILGRWVFYSKRYPIM